MMIVETIITTRDADGMVNVAPMGVEWGDETIVVKPFLETTTFRNLKATSVAVVNLTDDALLFARAALSVATAPLVPAVKIACMRLADVCSWRELEVRSIDDTPPRSRIETRVVHRGTGREWRGFNRARHAVLEAAIVATRTHILPPDEIRTDLARLAVIVGKTAGPDERDAFALVESHVHAALAARDVTSSTARSP